MKSQASNRPATFEAVGNGMFYYHSNVVQKQIETEGGETVTMYEYDEIIVPSPISSNTVLSAAIADKWGNGIEEKLINDYNAANEGILDESYKQKYLTFLDERKALKTQIETDVETWYNSNNE